MNDKIIRFPGGLGGANKDAGKPVGDKPEKPLPTGTGRKSRKTTAGPGSATGSLPIDPSTLSEDQKKALQIVLSGMSFVTVAIKATGGGADFFTAVHGDATDLRNATPHLPGVIERALGRKGI